MAGKGKTHKGLLKRVKITAKGKILRKKAGSGHLLSVKTGKKLRHLRGAATVPSHIAKQMKKIITRS